VEPILNDNDANPEPEAVGEDLTEEHVSADRLSELYRRLLGRDIHPALVNKESGGT
jgi:hypothetical protein